MFNYLSVAETDNLLTITIWLKVLPGASWYIEPDMKPCIRYFYQVKVARDLGSRSRMNEEDITHEHERS